MDVDLAMFCLGSNGLSTLASAAANPAVATSPVRDAPSRAEPIADGAAGPASGEPLAPRLRAAKSKVKRLIAPWPGWGNLGVHRWRSLGGHRGNLAKPVFQLHIVGAEAGEIQRRQIKRAKLTEIFAKCQPSLVAMEACDLLGRTM